MYKVVMLIDISKTMIFTILHLSFEAIKVGDEFIDHIATSLAENESNKRLRLIYLHKLNEQHLMKQIYIMQ